MSRRPPQTQAYLWAVGSLLASKLDTEQGSLHYLLGATTTGRLKLQHAVELLARQPPWSFIELPGAYINLATVESTTDDLDKAETLVHKTLDLYGRYKLPD